MNTKHSFWQHSLLLKLGGALALIASFAIFGMASSGIIAESVQGSGEAINLAGSLRMQTYRMTSLALSARLDESGSASAPLRAAIDKFDTTLTDVRITAGMLKQTETALSRSYKRVLDRWRARIKPQFLAEAGNSASAEADTLRLIEEIPLFVDEINDLVKQFERDTEAKILVLRMVLGAALLMTLVIGGLALILARNDVILPLRSLLALAATVGRGDLSARTEHTGSDELGRLGQAFNHMTEDLSRLYQNLEARVAEKTAELTIANRSLELLYHSIARLYNGPVAPDTYAILLSDLENVLGVGRGRACLVEAGESRARVIASTLCADAGRDMEECDPVNCGECLAYQTLAIHPLDDGRRMLSLPLKDTEHHYGVLQLEMPLDKELAQWQTQLLEALSRHIGIAIGTARRTEQSRRLSLLEERAAMARELHDSLAQSLAYMKIQVSRLKPLVERSGAGTEAAEVLGELREGLNSAYRQLRELLTTFRLRIEGEGLGAALQTTVAEFSGRGNIPITLDVHLAGCMLTPNEEIHALQIVREALSNVLNHARAQKADVQVLCNGDGSVSASVTDDGIGIRETADTHHYGMTIMEERAKNLGGSLSVENLPTPGTRITLRFTPSSQRDTAGVPLDPVQPS